VAGAVTGGVWIHPPSYVTPWRAAKDTSGAGVPPEGARIAGGVDGSEEEEEEEDMSRDAADEVDDAGGSTAGAYTRPLLSST